MPCPHFDIVIVSRGKKGSAVRRSAYQSAEKLYSERDHRTIYDKTEDPVVHKRIFLPANAPPEYADRNTLWNAVEAAEPNWNSQLCRRLIITLPRELPLEDNIRLIEEYCRDEFLAKGMIVDLCIHDPDPPGHNPHAHILLTMRLLDEYGHWMEKSRKEYVLDESGNRIRNANGKWKTRKVFMTDWDRRDNAEMWRHDWELIQNHYLEQAGCTERISMKSFERQGIERIPMVHQGPAVTAMERKGVTTDIGDLNRDIRKTNRLLSGLKKIISDLTSWLIGLKDTVAAIGLPPKEVYLVELLLKKFDERDAERKQTWSNAFGARKAGINDLKHFASIVVYMREKELYTVDDLAAHLAEVREAAEPLRDHMKQIDHRLNTIDTIRQTVTRKKELDPIHEQYMKINWKSKKQKFAEEHKAELDEWKKCDRYLRRNLPDGSYHPHELDVELAVLRTEHEDLSEQITPLLSELDTIKDIHWLVKDMLPELGMDSAFWSLSENEQQKKSVLAQLEMAKREVNARNKGHSQPVILQEVK